LLPPPPLLLLLLRPVWSTAWLLRNDLLVDDCCKHSCLRFSAAGAATICSCIQSLTAELPLPYLQLQLQPLTCMVRCLHQ
jgi:hypothetical protein